VSVLFTNPVPTDAYRGAGRPEACYVLERLVEEAAARLGFDRLELRRKNFIPAAAMPYTTAVGPTYDTGNFPKLFERVLELADHAGFPARREAATKRDCPGLASATSSKARGATKYAGMFGARAGFFDSADIRVAADGSLLVMCGTHSHGQAHATTFPQVLASRLGVPLDMIELVEGDTGRVPYGTGTFGSRSMVIAGSAMSWRRQDHRQGGAPPPTCSRPRRTTSSTASSTATASPLRHRSPACLPRSRAVTYAHNLPPGMEPVLHENAFDLVNLTWSNGAQARGRDRPGDRRTRLVAYVRADDIGTATIL
jgi:carbon-monoxide dehydrogenase large subunit